MSKSAPVRVLALLLLGTAGLLALAEYRWRARTAALVSRLVRGGGAKPAGRFSVSQLAGLPAPVERYFRAVLREGQPLVRHVRMRQRGQFLVRPAEGGWGPFVATEDLVTEPPGFVWDARIRMAPGIAVRVRDGFVDGGGSTRGSVLGLVPVVRLEGTPRIAEAALYRYLAEAVWCPTALLPSAGVVWTPLDGSAARATLTAGGVAAALDFHFGAGGLVERVFAPGRGREVAGRLVPTPWQGRWSEYAERGGMRIPLAGEVEWLLPEGPQPYWRGRVTGIAFDPPAAV